jgi:hypothetical protein
MRLVGEPLLLSRREQRHGQGLGHIEIDDIELERRRLQDQGGCVDPTLFSLSASSTPASPKVGFIR